MWWRAFYKRVPTFRRKRSAAAAQAAAAAAAGDVGSSTREPIVEAIEPQVFRRIRAAFGIDEANLSASISLQVA